MILTDTQLDNLKTAVEQALISRGTFYDPQIRFLFARGFLDWLVVLPMAGAPGVQLEFDLTNFNNVERLANGSVPLEIWLGNALKFLKAQTQATVIQEMLDITSSRMSGAPPVQAHMWPNLPPGSLPSGLEKTIDRDDTLPAIFIEGAQRVALSVVQLDVPQFEFGQIKLNGTNPIVHKGTGWFVTPDLIMTNWHVVNARDEEANGVTPPAPQIDLEGQAQALVATFDYDSTTRLGTKVRAIKLEAADRTLDYALVRLKQSVAGRTPLTLDTTRLEVQSIDDYVPVNIIQHPAGGPKRVAIRNNLVYRASFPTVNYFTDTEGGSSGSPVCTDDWRVVALHRSWKAVRNVNFQGKPAPCVNEGTQVAAIIEHLQQNHAALYAEVIGN